MSGKEIKNKYISDRIKTKYLIRININCPTISMSPVTLILIFPKSCYWCHFDNAIMIADNRIKLYFLIHCKLMEMPFPKMLHRINHHWVICFSWLFGILHIFTQSIYAYYFNTDDLSSSKSFPVDIMQNYVNVCLKSRNHG